MQIYSAFSRSDIAAILERLSDSVEWEYASGDERWVAGTGVSQIIEQWFLTFSPRIAASSINGLTRSSFRHESNFLRPDVVKGEIHPTPQ